MNSNSKEPLIISDSQYENVWTFLMNFKITLNHQQ